MVTTRVAQSSATEMRAPDEVGAPTRRRIWACAVPMTGVRYYRFLPDVTDPPETAEPDRHEVVPEGPGTDHGASVRGGS